MARLDEKMMMTIVKEEEIKPEGSGRIARRHVRRQIVMEDIYTEKEGFKDEVFEYKRQKSSWWMRTLTACMPSEDR